MSRKSYSEAMQDIVTKYRAEVGPVAESMRTVAAWAFENGLADHDEKSAISKLAKDLADAQRQRTHEDAQGRETRTAVCALVIRYDDDGKEEKVWLWDDIQTASYAHVLSSFQHRHRQVKGDVSKLRVDVGSYNDNHKPADKPDIQLKFKFDKDEDEGKAATA